ncbi:MAG TPA: Rieske (2Fe-2S) protein [Candidatus Tectomicrobia bacterium]|nr:Rieske (2Fe-2S) protein [Candidatus Tectomicrobia bacterium]
MSTDGKFDDMERSTEARAQSNGESQGGQTAVRDMTGYIKVGPLDDLRQFGCLVVTGKGHTISVFYHHGRVYAVDNRCPHMGFPLARGTVKDGILTCHWHHARFDLASGGTFDPFADDVGAFPVTIVGDEVWVNPTPPARDPVHHWSTRLREGLEHTIRLVIAKSVLGLQASGADDRIPLQLGTQFGMAYAAEGWGPAMSILTCVANMLPYLADEDRPRALYQGLLHIARECSGQPPRFPVTSLPTGETRPEVFKKWFRRFIDVRDPEGAERCLRTAIDLGLPAQTIAEMIFAAATDHLYLDSGHTVDYANKAFELLDHIGWEQATQVLPSLVHGMATARRSQELSTWRHPVDIASLVWTAREELPALYAQGRRSGSPWQDDEVLVDAILGDDPAAILEAIKQAIQAGASPGTLGAVVAHAAFLRMARFHTSNEFGDWETVHNTLTAANALHQALRRAPSVELLRGVFDSAMSIYLDRFLNMPEQRLPEAGRTTVDATEVCAQVLQCMNVQQQVEEVAQLVSTYLDSSADPRGMLATLGHVMLREDAGFHAFQIVDAAFMQYQARRGSKAGRHVLIGLARYLAAHAPTPRAVGQTYHIALRLHRGEELYREMS